MQALGLQLVKNLNPNLEQEFISGGLDISGMSSFISWVVELDSSTRHKDDEAAIRPTLKLSP